MEIKYIENISKFVNQTNEVIDVTIGFFDAVHIGHQKLINQLEKTTNKKGIITFDIHPNKLPIMAIKDKLKLLENFKIDVIYVIKVNDFNINKSEQEFIDFLKVLNVNEIIVGKDFRFGMNAKGDVSQLKQEFKVNAFEFVEFAGEKISSTRIREMITKGDLSGFKNLTNRNYTLTGIVVEGDQIGRTIDFPTANINPEGQVIMPGVYITRVLVDGKIYNSITNIGYRPTVGGKKIQIESNIFDFNDIIYSKRISVEFLKLIRHEKKFNSLEELKAQIKRDKLIAKEYYGN